MSCYCLLLPFHPTYWTVGGVTSRLISVVIMLISWIELCTSGNVVLVNILWPSDEAARITWILLWPCHGAICNKGVKGL